MAESPRLLVATRNPGKLTELTRLLGRFPLAVEGLGGFPTAPEVDETGATYAENAAAKAVAVARFTGLPCLGDDSGIEVDALDGGPGIRSARWAGPGVGPEALAALLLRRVEGVAEPRRGATMVCALCLALPGGARSAAEGRVRGRLTAAPRGAGGFGYDPIFALPDGRTLAEMGEAEKDRLSHRGRAVAALAQALLSLAAA